MSRNTEKAQSALNRFQAQKNKEAGVLESNPNLRPKYVQSVDSLPQAERWRSTILGEVSQKLTNIQDPSIGEHQIRELNESLNKLFKEKRAWEYHIKDLGGKDYIQYGPKLESTGLHFKGIDNNRYYGRAAELPEVQMLTKATKKKVHDTTPAKKGENDILNERLSKIDAQYYGLGDKNGKDNIEVTHDLIYELIDFGTNENTNNDFEKTIIQTPSSDEIYLDIKNIPSSEIITKWVVDQKKKELVSKYGQILKD